MIVEIHFIRDFTIKIILQAPGFEPMTLVYLPGQYLPERNLHLSKQSLYLYWYPLLGEPSRGHNNLYYSNQQYYPEQVHPIEVCNN